MKFDTLITTQPRRHVCPVVMVMIVCVLLSKGLEDMHCKAPYHHYPCYVLGILHNYNFYFASMHMTPWIMLGKAGILRELDQLLHCRTLWLENSNTHSLHCLASNAANSFFSKGRHNDFSVTTREITYE